MVNAYGTIGPHPKGPPPVGKPILIEVYCATCGGKGEVWEERKCSHNFDPAACRNSALCRYCRGKDKVLIPVKCPACQGKGSVRPQPNKVGDILG